MLGFHRSVALRHGKLPDTDIYASSTPVPLQGCPNLHKGGATVCPPPVVTDGSLARRAPERIHPSRQVQEMESGGGPW